MKSEKLYEGIGYVDEKWIALTLEPITLKKKEQKHFIAYEMKKLLGVKYLWVFLAVFIAVNSVVAWVSAERSVAVNEPAAMIADFFALYDEAPDELDAYFNTLTVFNDEQNKLTIEAARRGEDYTPQTLPNVYSTDEGFSDTALFHVLYKAIEEAAAYPQTIDNVIKRALSNLDEFTAMGLSKGSFAYRYQDKVIELYKVACDTVELEPTYTRGWNEYFAYDTGNVFLMLMLILLGTVIFTGEKQSGFLPILRTTRHGRMRTAVAKGLTALLVSSVFTMLFTVSTFAVYGMRLGFSAPTNAIQSLSDFALSPYLLTIGEYFIITLGLKLLAAAVFTMTIVALSVRIGNYTLVYLAGLGVFGVNLLLYLLPLRDTAQAAKYMNLFALADGDPLFVRYRAVNLFGEVAGYVSLGVPMYLIIGALLFALCCLLYTYRGGGTMYIAFIDTTVSAVMTVWVDVRSKFAHLAAGIRGKQVIKTRAYSLSLFGAECFKTLISSRFIFILILLLAVKIGYASELYAPSDSYFDAVYMEYMTELSGEVTDEKLAFLACERAMIDETIGKQSLMQAEYAEEKITFDEYRKYMSDYHYATSRSEILKAVEDQAHYLQMTEAETGLRGWFVYDTGWAKLFSSDADLFLYAAILLLLTGIFASEYASKSSSGSFAQLLRSTKHGRETTFYAKLASAETISFVLAMTMGAIDLVYVFWNYEVPGMSAPLVSLQMFGGITSRITLGGFAVLFFIIRLIGALLLSLLVCALSEILCKYLPILGSTVALTMLPALCAAFGLAAAEKISFLNLLAGTPLFLQSMRSAFFGGWAMLTLWLVVWTVVIGMILVPAKKIYVE